MEKIKMQEIVYQEITTLYKQDDKIYGTIDAIREIYNIPSYDLCHLEIRQLILRIFDQKELSDIDAHILNYANGEKYDHHIIICVGYRINSVLATRFRLWVARILIPCTDCDLRSENDGLRSQLAFMKVKYDLEHAKNSPVMKWYVFSYQDGTVLQRIFTYTNGSVDQHLDLRPEFMKKIIYVSKPLIFVGNYTYFVTNYLKRIDRKKNQLEISNVFRKPCPRNWFAFKAFKNYDEYIEYDQAMIISFFEREVSVALPLVGVIDSLIDE